MGGTICQHNPRVSPFLSSCEQPSYFGVRKAKSDVKGGPAQIRLGGRCWASPCSPHCSPLPTAEPASSHPSLLQATSPGHRILSLPAMQAFCLLPLPSPGVIASNIPAPPAKTAPPSADISSPTPTPMGADPGVPTPIVTKH